jgi:N6-adenosine-specific RNA methylase IME4
VTSPSRSPRARSAPLAPLQADFAATTAAKADTMPLDRASLGAHFAAFGYPAPHPFALLFPRMTAAEQAALTRSIRVNTMREPITMFNGQIADGIARCHSAIELGLRWERLPKTEFEGGEADLLQLVIDKNLNRRHLNESQRAMVAARMATMRQGARTDLAQICAMSQQEAADRMGVSRRLVQDAGDVLDRAVPELQEAVHTAILTVSAAKKAIELPAEQQRAMVANSLARSDPAKAFRAGVRNAEVQSRHRQIVVNARPHVLGRKRYPVLLGDGPWQGAVSWIGSPFPRLSVEQISQFRLDDGRFIREVVANDAILYMWVLDNLLLEVRPILEAWGGFHLCFTMPWPKTRVGIGHYARRQHELVLVCTRGNFPPPEEHLRPSTLIVGRPLEIGDGFHFAPPHDHRHSSKPDRLQEIIEQSYPQYFGPETFASPLALELFARNFRPKWDGQGYEYPGRPHHDAVEEHEPEMVKTRHAERDAAA